MASTLIVVSGPPLPGRWSLARALERRLRARRFGAEADSLALFEIMRALSAPNACVIVDGDLATREARAEVLELAGEGCERVLVEWRCSRKEAEREAFHRYASRPRALGAAELERYVADARVREPVEEVRGGKGRGGEARGGQSRGGESRGGESCGGESCGAERVDAQVVVVGWQSPLDEQVARIVARLHAPPPAPPAADDASERRVMVVEDDAEERAMLADVLEELGFVVEQAPDAGVAIALLDEGARIDLLISDHQMPGMTGVDLARLVADRHPDVRTVLLTAYSDEDVCRRAIEASAVTVLAKPLRVIDLERALDEA